MPEMGNPFHGAQGLTTTAFKAALRQLENSEDIPAAKRLQWLQQQGRRSTPKETVLIRASMKRITSQSKKAKYFIMPDITNLLHKAFKSHVPDQVLTDTLLIQLRLQTMMRSVDAAQIMWGALQHDHHTYIKVTDKSAKSKIFNITEPTLTLLYRYLRLHMQHPAIYLFRSDNHPHMCLGAERLAKRAKHYMAASGLNTDVFKSHSLRGAVATHLLSNGLDIHWVQERGGWSSTQTLQQHYSRLHLKQNWVKIIMNHNAMGEDAAVNIRHCVAAEPPPPSIDEDGLPEGDEGSREGGRRGGEGGHSSPNRPWHCEGHVPEPDLPLLQQEDGA